MMGTTEEDRCVIILLEARAREFMVVVRRDSERKRVRAVQTRRSVLKGVNHYRKTRSLCDLGMNMEKPVLKLVDAINRCWSIPLG